MSERGSGRGGDGPPGGPESLRRAVTLGADVDAPASCRDFVREQLRDAHLDDHVLGDLLLVVSELVSNAVQHGAGDPCLALHVHGDRVRVEVRDDAVDAVPVERPHDAAAFRGRGLMIVSALAEAWGHERREGAKWTWAELDTAGRHPMTVQTVG